MTIPIIIGISLVTLVSLSIGISYYNNSAFISVVYAQPRANNATTLPPIELEPVGSNGTEDYNNTAGSDVNSTEYLQYDDADLGFSIQHPSDWSIDDENSQFSTVIGFDSPDNDASVDVRIFPKGDYKSLKEYGDEGFKEDKDITLLNYYRNSSTLLGGKPAVKAIYLATYNPSVFENAFGYKSYTSKAMMVSTMVPEKKSIYAIAYFANGDDFNNYRPVVEKMIDSFRIYGKGPVIQEDNSSSSVP
jgi:hypothetical protein